ncbi:nucleoside hydrolase [Cereibacter sp. SYSU M97828]|nr:nucleoside hydrolase [Cereibacter flavus]
MLVLAASLSFAATTASAQSHKVIYDADVGVDDAMGLILLARHPEIDLLGVTTMFGNGTIDNTTRNTLYLQDVLGFTAPVARGAAKPAYSSAPEPARIHGANALGETEIPAIQSEADPRPAAQMIVDLVRENPGEVTLLMVGRSTNVALALAIEPKLPEMVKQVIIMGGTFGYNYGGKRENANLFSIAEANIGGDARAADEVINAGWPVAILPLDVTLQTIMSKEYLDALPGTDGQFIREITHRTYVNDQGATPVHDSSAIFYLLDPGAYTMTEAKVRVVPDGIAAGQTMMGKPTSSNSTYEPYPSVQVATSVDAARVLDIYSETIANAAE